MIVERDPAAGLRHLDTGARAPHLPDRSREAQAGAEHCRDPGDILAAAARHGAPFRAVPLQQAMVVEKFDEALRREFQHGGGGGRPDRGPHRHQIVAPQPLAKAMARQIDRQRCRADGPGGKIGSRGVLEPADFKQHLQKRRRQRIALLREQSGQHRAAVAPAPLEATLVGGDRKAHVGLLRLHPGPVEKRRQIGIVQGVVDDEAGIDGDGLAEILDIHRRRMTARPRRALVKHDFVAIGAEMKCHRGRMSRNSASDNGYPHGSRWFPAWLLACIRQDIVNGFRPFDHPAVQTAFNAAKAVSARSRAMA